MSTLKRLRETWWRLQLKYLLSRETRLEKKQKGVLVKEAIIGFCYFGGDRYNRLDNERRRVIDKRTRIEELLKAP